MTDPSRWHGGIWLLLVRASGFSSSPATYIIPNCRKFSERREISLLHQPPERGMSKLFRQIPGSLEWATSLCLQWLHVYGSGPCFCLLFSNGQKRKVTRAYYCMGGNWGPAFCSFFFHRGKAVASCLGPVPSGKLESIFSLLFFQKWQDDMWGVWA